MACHQLVALTISLVTLRQPRLVSSQERWNQVRCLNSQSGVLVTTRQQNLQCVGKELNVEVFF